MKVPGEFFPDTQFAAYVNIHSDPAGIRSFLLALCQATEELSESPKESELVRLFSTIQETEFSTHFEISRAELTTAIAERAATFMISNLDVETILAFWQAEATRRSILNKKLTIQQ